MTRERFIDFIDKKWKVPRLPSSQRRDELDQAIEVVAWSYLVIVLLSDGVRHHICKGTGNVEELLYQANAVNLHGMLREFPGELYKIAGYFDWVLEAQGIVVGHRRDEAVANCELPNHSLQPLL